jgi:hypothetical protein
MNKRTQQGTPVQKVFLHPKAYEERDVQHDVYKFHKGHTNLERP